MFPSVYLYDVHKRFISIFLSKKFQTDTPFLFVFFVLFVVLFVNKKKKKKKKKAKRTKIESTLLLPFQKKSLQFNGQNTLLITTQLQVRVLLSSRHSFFCTLFQRKRVPLSLKESNPLVSFYQKKAKKKKQVQPIECAPCINKNLL